MGIIGIIKGILGMDDVNGETFEGKQENESSMHDNATNVSKEVHTERIPAPCSIKTAELEEGKQHIYNLIIVDESGSMEPLREVTLSGVNETITSIKEAQKQFGEKQQHLLTLVTFDRRGSKFPAFRIHYDTVDIDNIIGFSSYHPLGNTPLYDAMGVSLTRLHEKIKDDENAIAVVTILTDGLENASMKWDAKELRMLIEQLKEEGWTFSYMGSAHNVKEVTDLLQIDNVMEFSHDVCGASSSWGRDRSSKMHFFKSINDSFDEEFEMSVQEKRRRMKERATHYYEDRVTPDVINTLKENEVFVFGSNSAGQHGGGAARTAMRLFGAEWGKGEGIQGKSYAIPTMEGLEQTSKAVLRFCKYAQEHPEKRFLVTRVGCGIAGYTPRDIAPLFKDAVTIENISLPSEYWEILGLRMSSMLYNK